VFTNVRANVALCLLVHVPSCPANPFAAFLPRTVLPLHYHSLPPLVLHSNVFQHIPYAAFFKCLQVSEQISGCVHFVLTQPRAILRWCSLCHSMLLPVSFNVTPCVIQCYSLCHPMPFLVSSNVIPCVVRCYSLCHPMPFLVSSNVIPCVVQCYSLCRTMLLPVSSNIIPCVVQCYSLCHPMLFLVSYDAIPCGK